MIIEVTRMASVTLGRPIVPVKPPSRILGRQFTVEILAFES